MKAFIIKHTEAILISSFAVFAPIRGMIIVAALAIVADFILGIIAAKKRGDEIKSSKMGITVSKLLIAETAIMMCYLVQHYLLQDSFPLTNWVAGIVGLNEIYSIIESLDSISGGKMFKEILTKLSSINHKKDE